MNLIIIGPQGCGKGTQAEKIAGKFDLANVEMGHLMRALARENSEFGQKINDIINVRKELAPDEVVVDALRDSLGKISKEKGLIVDGIPRTMAQIAPTEAALADCGRKINKVISIILPREISVERITKRYACSDCHKRLIMGTDIKEVSDVCPECGGEIYQRSDDSPEGVSKRLDIFYKETVPVIEYYREKGLLVEVDGKGSIEEVFEEIVKKIRTTDYH